MDTKRLVDWLLNPCDIAIRRRRLVSYRGSNYCDTYGTHDSLRVRRWDRQLLIAVPLDGQVPLGVAMQAQMDELLGAFPRNEDVGLRRLIAGKGPDWRAEIAGSDGHMLRGHSSNLTPRVVRRADGTIVVMAKNGRGSAGGRANEGGSVYRSSFGAYLIAYGLADHRVSLDAASPGVPHWLWFESDAPVDDLAVRFSSGARWDVQATARCDWGAKFRKTTAQWVRAARSGRLQPDDRVGLAAAQLSQPLLDLRDAFRRVREGGTFTPREEAAIAKLRTDADADEWRDVFDQITRTAVIVHLDCATELDPGFREAAVLLEATAVRTGSGVTAMAALRDFVHTEAARAGSSRPDRWVRVLTEVPLELGPTAPSTVQVTAVRLAEHRRMLAEDLDRLPLTFLGIAAEPLVVEGLLDRFRVELPGTDSSGQTSSAGLAEIARRWPALCVIGAAGAGKSTAMRQLAAAWAADVEAPVPVVVPMHRLVKPLRDGEPLSLATVVELGLAIDARLTPVLVDRLRDGSAALVLDGLDECRDQQDAAVQLIRRLAEQLHPSAGLVVSARDAVVAKATATGLPVTRLAEPRHLATVARGILDLVMSTARPDHSPAELAQARAWMDQSQSDHRDMWKVPLFSALLAAHAGRTRSASLPSNRADALVAAIKDSVGTWEQVKHAEPTAWQADLTPAQLIDGFTAIGHATARGSATKPEAVTHIVELLAARWGLPVAAARERADDVLAWWIGRVGAFTDIDEEIRPALRLFGEIADAMWASGQPDEVARAWMEAALADVSQYREPILLAASLSSTMRTTLMQQATTPAAVLLAAKAIEVGIEPTDDELLTIAHRLFDLNDPIAPPRKSDGIKAILADVGRNQAEYDGPTWRFLLALAQLPPRGAVSEVQARAIEAEADPERRLVLAAFVVVARCRLETQPPTEDEVDVLRELLDLPASEPGPPARLESWKLVIGRSQLILSGRLDAMAEAMDLVGLTDDQAETAVTMAGRGSMGDIEKMYDAIKKMYDAIENAGYAKLLAEKSPMAVVVAAMKSIASAYEDDRHTIFILDQAVAAAPHRAPEPSWRLEGAAALLEMLDLQDEPIGHINWAVTEQPQLVTNLVQFAMRSPQLDAPQVAADAVRAADLVREAPLRGLLFLLRPADPRRTVEPKWPIPSEAELDWLLEWVRSPSNWLAQWGVYLISNMTGVDGDKLLLDDISRINVNLRQRVATVLLSDTDTDELQTKWLAHPDQLVKAAAARVLGKRPLDPSQIEALVSDADLTIRFAALHSLSEFDGGAFERAAATALASAPRIWTCTDCGKPQPMDERDCGSCSRGSRSEMAEKLNDLREKRAKPTAS